MNGYRYLTLQQRREIEIMYTSPENSISNFTTSKAKNELKMHKMQQSRLFRDGFVLVLQRGFEPRLFAALCAEKPLF